MSLFIDIISILLLVFSFCALHSLFATRYAKNFVKRHAGNYMAFYRLGYNALSVFLLMLIVDLAPRPPFIIYDLPYPFDLVIYGVQVISLGFIVYTFALTNFREFLGVNQVFRRLDGEYLPEELDERNTFRKEKMYKYMRHPGYFFTIVFMAARPQMDVFYFTAFISFSCYFYIGSFLEEKKLIKQFGDSYIEYQKSVPRIFPLKLFGK